MGRLFSGGRNRPRSLNLIVGDDDDDDDDDDDGGVFCFTFTKFY